MKWLGLFLMVWVPVVSNAEQHKDNQFQKITAKKFIKGCSF